MPKLKAVVFDLDNTLVDFWKMKTMAVEAAVSAMIDAGLKIPKARALKMVYNIYDRKGIEYQKIFDDFLKEAIGKVDWKILAAGVVAYRKVKESFLDPYPHVMPTLLELIRRGYRLGVITDSARIQAWTRLTSLRLSHIFEIVITAEDVGAAKPSSKPFIAALRIFRLKPVEVAYVGDSIDRDMLGAKKVGMITILAKYGKGWHDKLRIKPDYTIEDISDLLKILK
ncbi:MAG: TIGR02253 family HAD-type hydrolase [Candidatus Aenigmatarchaeota archaeon]